MKTFITEEVLPLTDIGSFENIQARTIPSRGGGSILIYGSVESELSYDGIVGAVDIASSAWQHEQSPPSFRFPQDFVFQVEVLHPKETTEPTETLSPDVKRAHAYSDPRKINAMQEVIDRVMPVFAERVETESMRARVVPSTTGGAILVQGSVTEGWHKDVIFVLRVATISRRRARGETRAVFRFPSDFIFDIDVVAEPTNSSTRPEKPEGAIRDVPGSQNYEAHQ